MAATEQPAPTQYRRIILKFSGEVLRSQQTGESIDGDILHAICAEIREVHELGVEIGAEVIF
jgi:uridylate kinase